MLKAEKESLCREFEKVYLGEINFILGMSIKRDRATWTLTINQGQYVKDLLKHLEWKSASHVLASECKGSVDVLKAIEDILRNGDQAPVPGKPIKLSSN